MKIKIENVKNRLHSFIEDGKSICSRHTYNDLYISGTEYETWLTTTRNYLYKVFGDTDEVKRYSQISTNANGNLVSKAEKLLGILNSLFNNIDIYIDDNLEEEKTNEMNNVESPKTPMNNKVFIVHGHDKLAKVETARFVEKLGFEAVILHEQCNKGQTIIEKIESHTDVGFGIVLYTPCDVGGKDKDTLFKRARQNVVFEHGYLIGKLSRSRVCALVKGDIEKPDIIEKPGDISGIVFIQMDEAGAWELKLAKEMKDNGLDVDMNKL